MTHKKYVIIGAAAAGMGVVHKLRHLDPEGTITVISDEVEYPYNKCFLADYVARLVPSEKVYIYSPQQATEKRVSLLLGHRVTVIEREAKQVILADGQKVPYDALFLGMGASPVMPLVPGIDNGGVCTFHRLADIHAIINYIVVNKVRQVVVIGAGLSGLECADALRVFNLQITVVERGDQLLMRHTDATGSTLIEQKMKQCGIRLYLQEQVEAIDGDGMVCGVDLATGKRLDAQMVIWAIGVRSNIAIAQQAGLKIDRGLIVDDHMRTNDPHIYAGGDMVMIKDLVTGEIVPSCTWPDAMQQGMCAAFSMVGSSRPYPGAYIITSSSFFGLKMVSAGRVAQPPAQYEIVAHCEDDLYQTVLLEQGRIKGFLALGKTVNITPLKRALLTGRRYDTRI